MDFLLDPNIAYFVLVLAVLFVLISLAHPGTGVAEVVAIFTILLAGYAVYHLSLSLWALGLLLVSLVPFFFAVRGPRREVWLVLSILGLAIGSVFFFPARSGWISVNPILAVITSAILAAFVWFSARKVLQIAQLRPANDASAVIGQTGQTRTAVKDDGSVQVASELWSARSEKLIPPGRPVRVIGRDGFVLLVEERPLHQS